MRIRRLASAALLVTFATLTACGGDSEDKSGAKSSVLTAEQVEAAVITLADLGPGFEANSDDDDDDGDDSGFGCLNFDSVQKIKSDQKAEGDYQSTSDVGTPLVFSKIGSFGDENDAAQVLTNLRDAVDGCEAVDDTKDGGLSVNLKVSVDNETAGAEATEQVNMIATGTGSIQGITFPLGIRMTLIRIGHHITGIAYVGMGADVAADGEALTDLALARLVAAIEDQDLDPAPLNLRPVTEQDLVTGASA